VNIGIGAARVICTALRRRARQMEARAFMMTELVLVRDGELLEIKAAELRRGGW